MDPPAQHGHGRCWGGVDGACGGADYGADCGAGSGADSGSDDERAAPPVFDRHGEVRGARSNHQYPNSDGDDNDAVFEAGI